MRHLSRTALRLGSFAAILLAVGWAGDAAAQQACCQPEGACQNVADGAACNSAGGVLLPGEDCATDPCVPAACCFETACSTADAFSCISAGRDYAGAGVTCLDDPCQSGVGACCLNGTCTDDSPQNCAGSGGTWLGAGTTCADGLCDLGSCCAPGSCEEIARYECDAAGGVFRTGDDCATDPCAVTNDCATNSLYAQTRDNVNAFTGYTSEVGGGLQRWENFTGVVGSIETVTWWGFDLDLVGSDFVECVETNNQFQITFHEDLAGAPGPALCTYDLAVTATQTGIPYTSAQMVEYQVTLPTPCVLVNGWISVLGQGDPQCWFLWLSSPDGDGFSFCDNCQNGNIEPDDLSLCLGGTFGGVFGSCCDFSDGTCSDGVEIPSCATPGLELTPDATCAELDPQCTPTTGGCCFTDGTPCSTELPDDCSAAGGTWLGPGTDCTLCPVLGACCLDVGACSLQTEETCAALGNTWLGGGSECSECPAPPACAPGALFGQGAAGASDFLAGTSESASGLRRFENFTGVAGAVSGMTWWGLDLELVGSAFIECVETLNDFEISFHQDAGGAPGAAVCSTTVSATRSPTGLIYQGAELNEYSAILPASCVLVNGWVSIVGLGDPDCRFLWMSSPAGDDVSWCDNCLPSEQDIDLSVCLDGEVGGVFGSCCADSNGACADSIEITGCLQANRRFTPGLACSELDPPCGTILGGCCFDDATCTLVEELDCIGAGGDWLGDNTLCEQCPCVVPCVAGGILEGEQVCRNDYADVFNGGCFASTPAFSPISIGETVCGESGVFLDGLETTGDFDWYELSLTEWTELIWEVRAEFRPQVWIFDAGGGCGGATALATAAAFECDDVSVSAVVGPGTYWVVVGPIGSTDSAACPSAYTATLSENALSVNLFLGDGTLSWTPAPGATSYDIVRGDLGLLLGSAGDFTGATEECLADDYPTVLIAYPSEPNPGEAFWFLVRAAGATTATTYDSAGMFQAGSRDLEIAASPNACPDP